ncbi:MAG: M56 family metallopeptidase [Muribaculaceae bacterium]|nr:M56 family metallopeptidase [Muribaculaceae bacterium]
MLLSYSLISSIILAFGFIAYRLLLAGQSQHALNRSLLMMIYGISLIAPLVILSIILHHPEAYAGEGNVEIGVITGGILEAGDGQANIFNFASMRRILFLIYAAGVAITSVYFVFGLATLGRIISKGERTEFGTFMLILVDDSCKTAPFSWGRSIVMTHRDYEENGDMILIHEHSHLRRLHWIDLVTAYVTICIQWYNPFAWAMREQLKAVHEYEVDEMVMDTGVDRKEYQILLLKKAVGYGYQSLANNLNHSKLQKRVTMMYKKKTSVKRRMFALALIPAIGAGIAVTAIPSVAGVLGSLAETTVSNEASSAMSMPALPQEERDVFVAVEHQADFPGGMPALMQWLSRNIRYPEAAMKADIQGRVIVKFVVEADGSVTNAEIVKGVSEELDTEALRVVNDMPKWTPGKVNGKDVASFFTIPINFRLEVEKKEDTAQ